MSLTVPGKGGVGAREQPRLWVPIQGRERDGWSLSVMGHHELLAPELPGAKMARLLSRRSQPVGGHKKCPSPLEAIEHTNRKESGLAYCFYGLLFYLC